MIWFWMIATLLTFGISLIFHKSCREAIVSTILIIILALSMGPLVDIMLNTSSNTSMSGSVLEKE